MSERARIKIAGLGAISAAGNSPEAIFESIVEKRRPFTQRAQPPLLLGWIDDTAIEKPPVGLKNWLGTPRIAKISATSAFQAWKDSHWPLPAEIFYLGTARGWKVNEESPWTEKLLWTPWTSLTGYVASAIQCSEQVLSLQAACASGAVAIIEAALKLLNSQAKRAIAGGADSALSPEQLTPLQRMGMIDESTDKDRLSYPFSQSPKGMIPAEGAAFLALEKISDSFSPGDIELAGWAWRSDPKLRWGENGQWIGEVLDCALQTARCSHLELEALWAHGSGTPTNDKQEWENLEAWRQKTGCKRLILLSTKGTTGHAFGATSAIEAALACVALQKKVLPPWVGDQKETRPSSLVQLISNPQPIGSPWIATLSMGFWGETAALVFRRHD
ncbi:MAG: hypothetical protein NZM04_03885 [Methylacidiphilales bacterium]|nr:hypothetical protein [Candidatus Methylacidiphilales bacterium]MDW8348825.1 beta-ketoacyl synthase N-terminal-like domain-containing protein [Verrucomicrobiae bacterium]